MPWRPFARRLRIVAGIALALALIALVAWLFAIRWRPPVEDFALQGIDVSEAQGSIDWFAVKAAGASFAYLRATAGAEHRDARFAANWQDSYEAGVRRGAIHAFSLCRLAADQAGNFVTTVPRTGDALPAAIELDFEPDCSARPEREVAVGEIARLAQAIEIHTGKPVILKVSSAFERRYRIADAVPRSLWAVQSFFPAAYFPRPWRMWQASRFRRIDGVAAPVNWNVVAP